MATNRLEPDASSEWDPAAGLKKIKDMAARLWGPSNSKLPDDMTPEQKTYVECIVKTMQPGQRVFREGAICAIRHFGVFLNRFAVIGKKEVFEIREITSFSDLVELSEKLKEATKTQLRAMQTRSLHDAITAACRGTEYDDPAIHCPDILRVVNKAIDDTGRDRWVAALMSVIESRDLLLGECPRIPEASIIRSIIGNRASLDLWMVAANYVSLWYCGSLAGHEGLSWAFQAIACGVDRLTYCDGVFYWIASPELTTEAMECGFAAVHSYDSPALKIFGEEFYFVRDCPVTKQQATAPETLHPSQVLGEKRIAIRRDLIERIGWDRFCTKANLLIVHKRELAQYDSSQRAVWGLIGGGTFPAYHDVAIDRNTGRLVHVERPIDSEGAQETERPIS